MALDLAKGARAPAGESLRGLEFRGCGFNDQQPTFLRKGTYKFDVSSCNKNLQKNLQK